MARPLSIIYDIIFALFKLFIVPILFFFFYFLFALTAIIEKVIVAIDKLLDSIME
jgi:hypothetical protein